MRPPEESTETLRTFSAWAKSDDLESLPEGGPFEAVGNQQLALRLMQHFMYHDTKLLIPTSCFARLLFDSYSVATPSATCETVAWIATARYGVAQSVVEAHIYPFLPPAISPGALDLLQVACESVTQKVAQHAALLSAHAKRHFTWGSDVASALMLTGLGSRLPDLQASWPEAEFSFETVSSRDKDTIRKSGASPNANAYECRCANRRDTLASGDQRLDLYLRGALRALCYRIGIKFAPESTLRALADVAAKFCLGVCNVASGKPFSATYATDLAAEGKLAAAALAYSIFKTYQNEGVMDSEESDLGSFGSVDDAHPSTRRIERSAVAKALRKLQLDVYGAELTAMPADSTYLPADMSTDDDPIFTRLLPSTSSVVHVGLVVGCCPKCSMAPVFMLREWHGRLGPKRSRHETHDKQIQRLVDCLYEETILPPAKAAVLIRAGIAGQLSYLEVRKFAWAETGDNWVLAHMLGYDSGDGTEEAVEGFDDNWRELQRALIRGVGANVWTNDVVDAMPLIALDGFGRAVHRIAMRHCQYTDVNSIYFAAQLAVRWLVRLMEAVGCFVVHREAHANDLGEVHVSIFDAALGILAIISSGRGSSLYGAVVPNLAIHTICEHATSIVNSVPVALIDEAALQPLDGTLFIHAINLYPFRFEGSMPNLRATPAAAHLISLAVESFLDALLCNANDICRDSLDAINWLHDQGTQFRPILLQSHVKLAYACFPEAHFSGTPPPVLQASLHHPLVLTYTPLDGDED